LKEQHTGIDIMMRVSYQPLSNGSFLPDDVTGPKAKRKMNPKKKTPESMSKCCTPR
jgi:hypothetical protein